MRTNGLQKRAIGALSVVAASLFLALCLFNFGQVAALDATDQAGWHLAIAGWFVEVFGAGAYVMVVLPFIWGLVVYFREETPSLTMRASGTLLLACSVAMISGLLQKPDPGLWAGAIGGYTVTLTDGLGAAFGTALANTFAYTGALALFVASLIWATDWMFHTLRKGEVTFDTAIRRPIETEPVNTNLREVHDSPAEREFVRVETPGAEAAAALNQPAPTTGPAEPVDVKRVPEGFSADDRGARVMVSGPVGYAGVEFLPPSDELARPEESAPEYLDAEIAAPVLDDELQYDELHFDEQLIDDGPVDDRDASDRDASDRDASDRDASNRDAPNWHAVAPEATGTEPVIDVLPASAYTHSDADSAPGSSNEDQGIDVDISVAIPAYADESTAAPAATQNEESARPRSGIGIPDESPFVDEFFVTGGASRESMGGDGAAQHDDVEAPLVAAAPIHTSESPEALVEEPVAQAQPPSTPDAVEMGDTILVDEVLFAPASFDLIDDDISEELPAAIAARSAPPAASSAPPADGMLFADAPTASDTTDGGPDLSRLSGMLLDPLFHDAVSAVIERGRASGMVLQRNFGIGHARGIRLLEQMAAAGLVGDEDADGSRALLVTREAWDAFTGSRTA